MPRRTPKLLRGHCLSLNAVELAAAFSWTTPAHAYGSIRLFTDDPDGDQVAASTRGFLSNGGGLVEKSPGIAAHSVRWSRRDQRRSAAIGHGADMREVPPGLQKTAHPSQG